MEKKYRWCFSGSGWDQGSVFITSSRMRLLLLVQMPRFESLRIEPLTFKKCGAIEVQPATCCEDQPAVIFCLRSRLQGISGSISTSAWGRGFSSQWRIWWLPDRQPSFLIWGVPWKGMDRAWITVPGGCSDQLALSLHLENDGSTGGPLQPCWCSHSAPNTLRATRAASPQEYRDYLGMKGWGWVPEFLLMNLSTFMAEKIQSIINSINIFPHINIVRILVIFKWLSSSVPSGRLSKAMCSRSPEAGTWLISSFFFFLSYFKQWCYDCLLSLFAPLPQTSPTSVIALDKLSELIAHVVRSSSDMIL